MSDYTPYIVCGILSFPCICCCIMCLCPRTPRIQEGQPKPSLPSPEPPYKTEDPVEIV
jgi:hypothetical protein